MTFPLCDELRVFLRFPTDQDALRSLIAAAAARNRTLGNRLCRLVEQKVRGLVLDSYLSAQSYRERYVQYICVYCMPAYCRVGFAAECAGTVLPYLSERSDLYWPSACLLNPVKKWAKGPHHKGHDLDIRDRLKDFQPVFDQLNSDVDGLQDHYDIGESITDVDNLLIKQYQAMEIILYAAHAAISKPSDGLDCVERVIDDHLELGRFSVPPPSRKETKRWQIDVLKSIVKNECGSP